jgi:DtxR family Mn-dependent transcriptional regulator
MSDRILQEDALKHIHKSIRYQKQPTVESLAGALQINTNQAVDLLDHMQNKQLVELHGDSIDLTTEGYKYALQIIRAHRLYERYLSEETGFREEEWHDRAERYEHDIDQRESNILAAQLGNPTHDPHGDPIPTEKGELIPHGGKPLNAMPLDTPLRIVHMEDEPEAVYAQLVAEGLHPGMEVQILDSDSKRIRLWANGDEHVLAPIVASSVSVVTQERIPEEQTSLGDPLSSLQPGEQGSVIAISPQVRGQERRRMMDLGILPGTTIKAEMNSPSGDPTAYRIRGALIALREQQANMVRIKSNEGNNRD